MYATPCERPCGGCCLLTATSDERPPAYITSSHARDGVLSCEGVILPCLIMIAVSTGFLIQPHPRLVAWNRQTQCPVMNQVQIPVTQCPGIFLTPFPVLLVVTFPALFVVTFPVLLVLMSLVLLVIKRIPVFPALITLCLPIPKVLPSVKTMKTKCPPLPRASR